MRKCANIVLPVGEWAFLLQVGESKKHPRKSVSEMGFLHQKHRLLATSVY